ncbi:type 1 glutamine amidotransferase [Sphingobium sp. YBL2]|uniref:type 1 glutamine amidotransferase n=1 Tax=Sphingobium sp. (strain YBL2) TaxID=484429 RepID=UPI0005CBFAAE|nr:type 1 glutamine amidotransferase [Sphingobium sp. YBL2]AJR26789.1 adoT [Sphingobium sp. YBL2]
MKKFATIWCSPVPQDDELKPELQNAFGGPGEQWDVLYPDSGDLLPVAANYDGFVIGGSPKSVVEDAETPLVKNLLNLIRWVRDNSSSPIVGVCFGSQALAVALGGRVDRNPGGAFKCGVDSMTWTEAADGTRWPETARPATLAKSHGECVIELPPDSIHLASSRTIENEIYLTHGRFLGVQGHPEVSNEALRKLFMPSHRSLFSDEQWRVVEAESQHPLEPSSVKSLGRRLLADRALQAIEA